MRSILVCLLLSLSSSLCFSQNVFNPLDTQARYNPVAAVGTRNNPNPARTGLQKWVSSPTNGVSSAFDASSYKAYYINVGGRRMAFRLKFPYSYTKPEGAAKRYPVMLFFHGAGEPG